MGLFKKYGGTIAYLNLERFWGSLSKQDQQRVRRYYSNTFGSSSKNGSDLDSPKSKVSHTTQTASQFLWGYSSHAIADEQYDLAGKMLLESERKASNPIDLHFTYNQFIKLYYAQRGEDAKALDHCIKYCKKDIKLFPRFKHAYIKDEKRKIKEAIKSPLTDRKEKKEYKADLKRPIQLPGISSFDRLAMIYSQQGHKVEADKIDKLAREFGIS